MTTLEINEALADKIVALAQQQQQSVDDFLATLLVSSETAADNQSQQHQQLEDETRTYKAAVEASNDLIIVVDKQYRYLIANETYLKYHHVERHQIIGRQISSVVGQPLFDAELKHRYDRCFAGETQSFENTYRYPTLGTRHTFATWLPVRDEVQQVIGAVVIIHDITERKQMELARRANEKKFQTLFDVLPVGISLLNHQREIVQANPMLEKILDKPMAALLTGDLMSRHYIHGDGTPILPDEFPWEVAIREQQPVIDVEVGVVKENGDTIWTSLNAAPLADDDLSAVVVTRDITRRKQAETLTRQLQVEREQVKILREFISNVSHDLNTPITQIITSLYLLKRAVMADTEQRRLAKLEAYTHQIRDIVQDLIQMSELDAKENLDYVRTDMKLLLETLMMEYAPAAQHKNQHLTFNCQLDTFTLDVDEGYLRLALQNMLDNAIEYTHDGGSIVLAAYHQANEYAIEIVDSGIGIDEQHLPHIFERFYRVDKARPVGDGHTGMGLAIAHKIIQIHHGWIEVESRPYHGSIFRIVLPQSTLG
jgi:PAS domain S-box-containing protein